MPQNSADDKSTLVLLPEPMLTQISRHMASLDSNELTICMLHFSEGTKTYLHFMSLLHINMTQVVEIIPHVRQGPNYPP